MRVALLDDSGDGPAGKVESAIGRMQVVTEREGDDVLLGQPESSEWFLLRGSDGQ